MNKKLPSVFANKNLRNVKNNKTVYYTSIKEEETKKDRPSLIGKNVNQKINSIFNSNSYIYKAEVEITLEDGKIVKKIIGKQSDNLITMDNEKIPINKIIDIDYKK